MAVWWKYPVIDSHVGLTASYSRELESNYSPTSNPLQCAELLFGVCIKQRSRAPSIEVAINNRTSHTMRAVSCASLPTFQWFLFRKLRLAGVQTGTSTPVINRRRSTNKTEPLFPVWAIVSLLPAVAFPQRRFRLHHNSCFRRRVLPAKWSGRSIPASNISTK